ncbi:DUF1129 domain-containing protein [Carnobacterium pleistocenium]|uniref:DUF1129 domain-containing protein n=1 Tax=Carnobacterium pleistocenium TaxID=181073 RepID=UPI0005597D51|nr:DUF1129 family protein [Carnobacterium pleistocenium]
MEETQVNTTQAKKEENSALLQKLTKRNEQYMMSLNKALAEKNMPEAKKEEIFNDMLHNLVERQKSGETARQLYGTVTECANQLVAKPEQSQTGTSENWKIALDGGLMLGGLFSLITGLSSLFSNVEGSSSLGLITTLLNFVIGGVVILLIAKNMPDRKQPKKGGMLRYILVSTLGMLTLMFVMTGSMMIIPATINIPINTIGNVVIGILAFVAKYFAKRKLNIRGGLF